MLLAYREESKQPRRPIAGLPAPSVLSSAGKLIRYLHKSYLPYRNTVYTCLHASSAARQNTIELIISNAVYTGCGVTRQIPNSKLLRRCFYDVLRQISNDFQRSHCHVQCRQTLAVAARRPVASGVDPV